jgi:hypothetical protein
MQSFKMFNYQYMIYVCFRQLKTHVKCAPCFDGMACPQLAGEGDSLQLWRVAANILNKQLQTTRRVWSSSLRVQQGVNHEVPVISCYVMS